MSTCARTTAPLRTVQFRQGLDFTVSSLLLSDQRLYATAGFYFGYQLGPQVATGIEVFEAYAIDLASVRDGNRESLVVSPNVRLALPWVQPAVSAFTNLGPPISAPWVQRESRAPSERPVGQHHRHRLGLPLRVHGRLRPDSSTVMIKGR